MERGHVFFRRLVGPKGGNTAAFWKSSTTPLSPLVPLAKGTIEDDHNNLQVDFANRSIGGGVIAGGCVQEEIRYAVCFKKKTASWRRSA